jgi:dTDP-3-amino-3,4,6-trideoxy-alpha-D-glucose transaminase
MDTILPNDFRAQWARIRLATLEAVDRVGQSGWWILGAEVEAFERALGSYWGLPYAVGCASGVDALEIGLRASGLEAGDEVLTTPLSAFATTLAVIRAGGVPVFVDVDASGQLDLDLAERVVETRGSIRFMLPVHLFGHAMDEARLESLRHRFELRIVEDCAQAIGARSRGVPVGSVGCVAATSFYPTKNLGALGDGGAVLTSSEPLAALARALRDYGQTGKYEHRHLGLNSRLDELHAAVLRDALLPELATATRRRREIAARYREGIRHQALHIPPAPEGSESVWHLFPVLVDGSRDAFQEHLRALGVGSGRHYPTLIPDQEAMKGGAPFHLLTPLDRAREFAEREVSLPMHPDLEDVAVERVIEACDSWRP